MADDRIAKLSQRFNQHAVGRKSSATRTRERRSFYLDAEVTARIDRVHKELNHSLYPIAVSKSVFLETVLEYGLEHLDELKPILSQTSAMDDVSALS